MPYNGAGVYSPPAADFPAASGTLIQSTKFNNVINDLATGLTTALTKDGQTTPTQNLPMGGFKHLVIADAALRNQYASWGQVQDDLAVWGGVAGGTADALTLTLSPTLAAYAAGQRFYFQAGATPNTGAATLAINGLLAKSFRMNGAALVAGDIEANKYYSVFYDGFFHITRISPDLVLLSDTNTWTAINTFVDSNLQILGSVDATKKSRFENDTLVPTGTTVTVTIPAVSGTIAYSSDPFAKLLINDYISGFGLTTASTTTYDIAAGFAADSTNTAVLVGAAITAKSQAAWVAGSAVGGKLSAAAMANNTWYYWFAIYKTVDGTVDYGFDVSTAPTLPSGYSKYRYIGARKTALGSTNWDTFIQHGDEVLWSTPPAIDVNGALSTANRTLTTMNIPAARVKWFGRIQSIVGGGAFMGVALTDPLCADVAAANAVGPLADWGFGTGGAVANLAPGWQATCWANASSQIGIRGTAANLTQIQTLGWIDPRGKPV